ncbi:MAG: bacteriohemerythrin [Sideroxydans sp.]|jgi:hemerythrin-like metal-binding protein
MDKEKEMLGISKLVFELTTAGHATLDMDILLERLFAILNDYHDLQLEPHSAILLVNPQGRYLQVAQFGLKPVWETKMRWESAALSDPVVASHCLMQYIPLPDPTGEDKPVVPVRAVLLPLRIENEGIGYAVMFTRPSYEMTELHLEFLDSLARALSGLIQRTLTNETLRIREFELEEARSDVLRSLGVASEYRDNETGWHIMRVTNFAQAIAKALNLPESQRELLAIAAPMHDVGKIGIPDKILHKPDKLTEEEYEVMKTHTNIGINILNGKDEMIVSAREIAGSHHERWDGTGYPCGLKGEEIPLLARICAVADVFDALTSARPYKEAWTTDVAHEWVLSQSDKHFDPDVIRAFDMAMPEILRIRELYRDDIISPKQKLALPPIRRRENAWIPWDESLSVGIDVIDEHHRYLFDLINDLYAVVVNKRGARYVARLLKALDIYAKIHFRAEEEMMIHYGFKDSDHHHHQHNAFGERIGKFFEQLHINPLVVQFDVLTYLQNWLIHHIRIDDSQLTTLARS